MKNKYKLYVVFVLLLGCSSFIKAQNNYYVEDTVYQCLIKGMAKENISFDRLIDTIHKEFVENKIMSDYSGVSTQAAIERLMVDSVIEYKGDLKNIEAFNIAQQMSLKECIISTDTTVVVDTAQKLMKLVNGLNSITNVKGPGVIAKLLLQHLTAKDFEHPLYKMFALALITMRTIDDNTYKEFKKYNKERQSPENGFYEVSIVLTDSNTIFYKGFEIEMTELEMFIAAFLSGVHNKVKVIVETTGKTSPVFYNEVYDILQTSYIDGRNMYSQRTYSYSYDKLSDELKQKVDEQLVLEIEKVETGN
jgi:hypothetical protein